MLTAKNAMSAKIITISPEASIEEAIGVLLDHHISGAPVLDAAGNLLGIVSEFQLLEVTYDPTLRGRNVRDFMTKSPITVASDTPLPQVVSLLILHRIRRLPVLDNGRLVGIIARRDVLRCLVENRFAFGELSAEQPAKLVCSA